MDQFHTKIIGALVKKLGGKVDLTDAEIDEAPIVTATRLAANKNITLWIDEKDQPKK